MRILELFGGIGACTKALERLGIDYEIADYVEIDKYAAKSFNAIHGTNFEPQDICTWDKDIDVDLICGGFPCQDISLAGQQKGIIQGETRSGLMYEMMRIIKKIKPKYVIAENVKNLLSQKFRPQLEEYLCFLNENGYKVTMNMLNAKDYGIPQNRERVFTISILGKDNYDFPVGEKCENKIQRKYGLYNQATRWGVYDKNGLAPTITASMGMGGGHVPMIENFDFPPKQELKLKLKDMLEDDVDEKYYLSKAMLNYMYGVNQKPSKFPRRERFEANINRKNQDVANSVTTNVGNRPTDNFIKIKNATKKGYDEATNGDSVNLSYPDSKTRRGRVGHQVSQTLQCNENMGVIEDLRIRKLTPKECWRLMGFDDEDFEKAKKVNSNTQLYKQAGNSIVVNVLEKILENLLCV